MKPELTFEYLQSIESEPLPKIFRDSERLAIAEWKQDYADWEVGKMEQPIPAQVWAERLKSNWARLAEYDRLTAERKVKA